MTLYYPRTTARPIPWHHPSTQDELRNAVEGPYQVLGPVQIGDDPTHKWLVMNKGSRPCKRDPLRPNTWKSRSDQQLPPNPYFESQSFVGTILVLDAQPPIDYDYYDIVN